MDIETVCVYSNRLRGFKRFFLYLTGLIRHTIRLSIPTPLVRNSPRLSNLKNAGFCFIFSIYRQNKSYKNLLMLTFL